MSTETQNPLTTPVVEKIIPHELHHVRSHWCWFLLSVVGRGSCFPWKSAGSRPTWRNKTE